MAEVYDYGYCVGLPPKTIVGGQPLVKYYQTPFAMIIMYINNIISKKQISMSVIKYRQGRSTNIRKRKVCYPSAIIGFQDSSMIMFTSLIG